MFNMHAEICWNTVHELILTFYRVCHYMNVNIFFTFSVSLQQRTFSTLEFYRDLQDKLTPASLHMFQSDWDESVRDTFWHTLGEDSCSISFINFLCFLVLVSCIKQNVTIHTKENILKDKLNAQCSFLVPLFYILLRKMYVNQHSTCTCIWFNILPHFTQQTKKGYTILTSLVNKYSVCVRFGFKTWSLTNTFS